MPSALSPVIVEPAIRRAYAYQLRAAGLNFREILEAVRANFGIDKLPHSYDERFCYKDVAYEFNRMKIQTMETASDMRVLELTRLDQMQTSIMPKAIAGDLKAVDRVLKIMNQRANLMGLYAPTKSKIEVNDWRSEIIAMIKNGTITRQQAEEELGTEVIRGLLDTGSENVVEGSFVEEESGEDKSVPE